MDYVSINSTPDDDSRERQAAVYSRYKYYSRLAPHPDNPMVSCVQYLMRIYYRLSYHIY